jgi:hypothetical protein
VGDNSDLQVIDISDPTDPKRVGQVNIPGLAGGVAVAGNYAYVAGSYIIAEPRSSDAWGLHVIDISEPSNPRIVGELFAATNDVAVAGDIAYVTYWHGGLQAIDVSDPASPTPVGGHGTPGSATSIALAGNYAYVTGSSGLVVFDITNPSSLAVVGELTLPGSARGIAVGDGGLPCMTTWGAGLKVLPRQCEATVAVPDVELAPPLTGLGSVFPNPSGDRHSIDVRIAPGHPAGGLRIYDVAGRLVWRLDLSGFPPGSHVVSWDGRGLDGRPSPASVYFMEIDTPAGPATRRIVRTR